MSIHPLLLVTLVSTALACETTSKPPVDEGSARASVSASPGPGVRAMGCPLEENCDCPIPGVTVRWIAAYCMARAQTDDEGSPLVSDCIGQSTTESKGIGRSACDANAYWKQKTCEQTQPESVVACGRDDSFLPYPVPAGVGS